MPFLEQRISTGVRRGSTGGPTAKRKKHYTDAGLMAQVVLRTYPLQRFVFDFGTKIGGEDAQEEDALHAAEEIRAFFYVVMFGAPGGGAYTGFRARDWNDYQLTQTNSRLVAVDGGFQICRVYTVGAAEYVRPIRKIEPGTAIVYNAGSPVAATVDEDTAIVTSGGNAAYTVEANFDIPVTFADDDAMANIGLDGSAGAILLDLGQIELEELPLGVMS